MKIFGNLLFPLLLSLCHTPLIACAESPNNSPLTTDEETEIKHIIFGKLTENVTSSYDRTFNYNRLPKDSFEKKLIDEFAWKVASSFTVCDNKIYFQVIHPQKAGHITFGESERRSDEKGDIYQVFLGERNDMIVGTSYESWNITKLDALNNGLEWEGDIRVFLEFQAVKRSDDTKWRYKRMPLQYHLVKERGQIKLDDKDYGIEQFQGFYEGSKEHLEDLLNYKPLTCEMVKQKFF